MESNVDSLPKSLKLFYQLSEIIHANNKEFKTIELDNFIKIVKQCTIDFYTENKLNDFSKNHIDIIRV